MAAPGRAGLGLADPHIGQAYQPRDLVDEQAEGLAVGLEDEHVRAAAAKR